MNGYRVKLLIALEKDGSFLNKNEILLPGKFLTIEEAHETMNIDIERKLGDGDFFRSQRYGFDLVRYRHTASQNIYLAYKVVTTSFNKHLFDRDFQALTYI